MHAAASANRTTGVYWLLAVTADYLARTGRCVCVYCCISKDILAPLLGDACCCGVPVVETPVLCADSIFVVSDVPPIYLQVRVAQHDDSLVTRSSASQPRYRDDTAITRILLRVRPDVRSAGSDAWCFWLTENSGRVTINAWCGYI